MSEHTSDVFSILFSSLLSWLLSPTWRPFFPEDVETQQRQPAQRTCLTAFGRAFGKSLGEAPRSGAMTPDCFMAL